MPSLQRSLGSPGCSPASLASLITVSHIFSSSLFLYNERGKNAFVISWWGETMALLTLAPPAGAESPSQGRLASRLSPGSFTTVTHSATRTAAKGGCYNLLPTPTREPNGNLWLGSSRGRRGGPGRQRGLGGRSSCCHGPGHADFCCSAAPRGLASSLLKPSAHTGQESLSFLAQQRLPMSSNISCAFQRCLVPVPGVSRPPSPRDALLHGPLVIDLTGL